MSHAETSHRIPRNVNNGVTRAFHHAPEARFLSRFLIERYHRAFIKLACRMTFGNFFDRWNFREFIAIRICIVHICIIVITGRIISFGPGFYFRFPNYSKIFPKVLYLYYIKDSCGYYGAATMAPRQNGY